MFQIFVYKNKCLRIYYNMLIIHIILQTTEIYWFILILMHIGKSETTLQYKQFNNDCNITI